MSVRVDSIQTQEEGRKSYGDNNMKSSSSSSSNDKNNNNHSKYHNYNHNNNKNIRQYQHRRKLVGTVECFPTQAGGRGRAVWG